MAQEHKQKNEPQQTEEVVEEELEAKDQQELTDSVEDILDEIDDVLEANAEEFVKGFVQKGGQ